MKYKNTKEATTYRAKKHAADLAREQYINSQAPMDWEWFMLLEEECGSYAAEHEEKIFVD